LRADTRLTGTAGDRIAPPWWDRRCGGRRHAGRGWAPACPGGGHV